ncbi:AraC family transcriptional regulator [uncultured Dokdonia sp.]|uniref:AraC family transcriptional regulator n=1 Tax=uncultured Dokdonia sp. TaxID=575653 RepID=UPI0026370652|nr:AraC family transcriptional regulator [uncultured Dokdonia sp.]
MNSHNQEIESDYKSRINRVFQYIDQNLENDLSLQQLSEIAFFSPYHFHRIFKYITNETVNEYVTRRRLEKAAAALLHTNTPITEIALLSGFKDNSTFTRAFKKFYGVAPSLFKKEHPNKFSKIRQVQSKNGQVYPAYEKYICIITNHKKWIHMNATIEVKETPTLHLAGVTHIGIHDVEHAFGKLIQWATPKDLLKDPAAKLGRVFYDSIKITAPDKVRMSIFLITDTPFKAEGEIHKLTIQQGKCIVGRFEIAPNEFEKSWTGLFIWMNENGYKKSSGNPYEIYHNDYREHPENKFIVDLYIPVE